MERLFEAWHLLGEIRYFDGFNLKLKINSFGTLCFTTARTVSCKYWVRVSDCIDLEIVDPDIVSMPRGNIHSLIK